MRPVETLLILANLVTFIALVAPLPGAIPWFRYSAVVALGVAILQVLIEGPRWQMFLAYALAGVFFLIWLLQILVPGTRFVEQIQATHLLTRMLVGLGIFVVVISILPPIFVPVFHFPRPSGPYPIGTLTYHWVDASRPEVFTVDPNDRRELMAQIWYPAKEVSSPRRAPYVPNVSAPAPTLARLFHLPKFAFGYLKYVTTNAIPSAPIAGDKSNFPVLIFLEGYTSLRQANTYQIQGLVSHGYIVVALDQPGAAVAVVFPDGRQIAVDPQLLPLVYQSLDPKENAPGLNGQAYPEGIIPYLEQDVGFTLDQLAALNQYDPNGILTEHLDLQHIGVIGDSLGGIVAGEACHLEPRIKACLDLDAALSADVVQSGLRQPTMWISRGVKTMQLEGWRQIDIEETQTSMHEVFDRLPGDGYLVLVPGIFHLNFNDTPYYSPLTSVLRLTGPINPWRAHRIINAYSLAFFDRELKGRPSPLLDGSSGQFPEVIFQKRH